ncbi:cytochrome P450 [Xylogone sp. PMI_703]|nr:cytochrome P450 [Xylogone sp. PMI_703]
MEVLNHDKGLSVAQLMLGYTVLALGVVSFALYPYTFILTNPPGNYVPATDVPYALTYLTGRAHKKMLSLHQVYGPVIRMTPDRLSSNHPEASKSIRGHRKASMPEHNKDPGHVRPHQKNILGADFMLEQEPLITKYVDILMEPLQKLSSSGNEPLDIVKWYNYTTFDIIGNLAFGEPFSCLESFISKEPVSKFAEHQELSQAKVRKRLTTITARPDFINAMTEPKSSISGDMLSFEEQSSNAFILIIASSETTATALSAAIYFLGITSRTLDIVVNEIHSTFTAEHEINLVNVQKLLYILTIFDKTLQVIAEDGDTILGHTVSAGTKIDLWPWDMNHNNEYITQPDDFIPEQIIKPFSNSSWNCIRRNLVYAEMRLILARLLCRYDIRLAEDNEG